MEDVIVHKQIVKITLFQNPKNYLKCPITTGQLESFHPFLYTYKKKFMYYNVERKKVVLGGGRTIKLKISDHLKSGQLTY